MELKTIHLNVRKCFDSLLFLYTKRHIHPDDAFIYSKWLSTPIFGLLVEHGGKMFYKEFACKHTLPKNWLELIKMPES